MSTLVSMRYRAGLSQEALAERMGVTRSSIGHFETRNTCPRLDTLQRYAEAVGAEITATPKPRPEQPRPVRLRIICDTCRDDGEPKHWDQTCEDCAAELLERHAAEHTDHTFTMLGRLPSWP